MMPRLYNRFVMPADGWTHFVPKGEFPWVDPEDPKNSLIQVVDDRALELIQANLPAELFIDVDHLSQDLKNPTTAQGWVYGSGNSQIRPDGLYMRPKWSEAGLSNIAGGNMRYVSPVFDPEALERLADDERTGLPRYRVTRLLEAGLTNKPNMRPGLKPLSNRAADAPDGTKTGDGIKPEAATKENDTNMKLVNRALDLSPDASEEAALAGIEKLKTNSASALTQLAAREKELTDAKALLTNREQEIKRLEGVIAAAEASGIDREIAAAGITDPTEVGVFKTAMLANREAGTTLLKLTLDARKKAEEAERKEKAPLTNRGGAGNPGSGEQQHNQEGEATGLDRTVAAFRKKKGGE